MKTDLKLSEAIRIGAQKTEPLVKKFADFYYTQDGARVECRCALGAACYAVDPTAMVDNMADIDALFGDELMNQTVRIDPAQFPEEFTRNWNLKHIVPSPFQTGLSNCVVRMNDYYQLTREDIAAVLQTLGF